MITVRLMVDVIFHTGATCFFRDIEMPALPQVGCVFSSTGDHDCMEVKRVWYLEPLSLFVAELETYDIRNVLTANAESFLADGWIEETKNTAWPVFPVRGKMPAQTPVAVSSSQFSDLPVE